MPSAAHLRLQIEAVLAVRARASLALVPRLVRPGFDTGHRTLDAVLNGGLPTAGTSEIVGGFSSGRTSLAAAYLAERARDGYVCAWIDAAAGMDPGAALAGGALVERVLWIRCAGGADGPLAGALTDGRLSVGAPAMCIVSSSLPAAKPDLRPYNPTRNRQAGTPGVANRLFAKPAERVEQVNSDRAPSRRGFRVVKNAVQAQVTSADNVVAKVVSARSTFVKAQKPWSRIEQAIKSVDLLIQGGGFGTIVLDLGSIEPRFARRIPLATWFRWRAAAERTRTSLVVLSQLGCTGSSAELVVRVEADLPEAGTVLTGISYRLEVVRRRFAEATPPSPRTHQPEQRKQPQSAGAAVWQSQVPWVAS